MRFRVRWAWLPAAPVLLALVCAVPAHADEWSKKYSFSGKPIVHVQTNDGNIDIYSGPAGELDAHVTTNGYRIPNDVHVNESQNGNSIDLDVRVPSMHFNLFGGMHKSLHIELHVPAEADLDVQSGDGNVTSQSVSGNIRINTGDGNINAQGLKGDIRLHTGDGHIEAYDLDGGLNADTGDGHMNVRGRFDSLYLKSGDGSIEAEAAQGSKIASSWTLHTGDGRIELRLPDNFAADLEAHTGDGHISLDFPVTVQGSLSNTSIHGKMNGGGGSLTLTSGDGSIRVEKM